MPLRAQQEREHVQEGIDSGALASGGQVSEPHPPSWKFRAFCCRMADELMESLLRSVAEEAVSMMNDVTEAMFRSELQ